MDGETPVDSVALTTRHVLGASLALLVAAVVAWSVGPALAASISDDWALGASANPYFVPSHFVRLYLAWPLVAVAALTWYLAPGLLFVLAWGRARTGPEWVVLGFLASLGLSILAIDVVKVVGFRPLTPGPLLGGWLILMALGAAFAWRRAGTGEATWPVASRGDVRRLGLVFGTWFLMAALLVPKLFWSDFSSDGIEAFEFGRSLSQAYMPTFDLHEGTYGFYQNFWPFAFPVQWSIQLFGPIEVSSRIPFLLYVGVAVAAVILLAEVRQTRRLRVSEDVLVWAGVLLYAFVQAFASTYEPFQTDLAEPSATDTLWTLAFVIAAWALWAERPAWFLAAAVLCHSSSGGGLLLLMALAGVTFVFGGEQSRKFVKLTFIAVGIGVLISVLHRVVYVELLLGGVKDQLGGENLLGRLLPPKFFEFGRLNFLIFPSGIVPAAVFVLVRRARHPFAWVLMGSTLAYFGVIYVQKWTGIHQFTPVMLLPMIVFWRWRLAEPETNHRWAVPAVALGTVLSFFLSAPKHFQISQGVRAVGLATDYGVPGYETDMPRAAAAKDSFLDVLRHDYRVLYPHQPWGADNFALMHYAHRPKPEGTVINYVIRPEDAPAPPEYAVAKARGGFKVYVLDEATWQRHRNPGMPRRVVSDLYDAPLLQSFELFREVSGIELPAADAPQE